MSGKSVLDKGNNVAAVLFQNLQPGAVAFPVVPSYSSMFTCINVANKKYNFFIEVFYFAPNYAVNCKN